MIAGSEQSMHTSYGSFRDLVVGSMPRYKFLKAIAPSKMDGIGELGGDDMWEGEGKEGGGGREGGEGGVAGEVGEEGGGRRGGREGEETVGGITPSPSLSKVVGSKSGTSMEKPALPALVLALVLIEVAGS
jgi:hypothetical protein